MAFRPSSQVSSSEITRGLFQALEGYDAWSLRAGILARQDALSLFLAHAAEKVPHYRSHCTAPWGSRYRLEDFPLISREDLASGLRKFLATPSICGSRLFAKTSGSTGKPLTIIFDQESWYDLNYETYAEVARTIPGLLPRISPGELGVVLLTAEIKRYPASLILLSLNCSLFKRRILGIDSSRDLRLVRELRQAMVPILYGKPTYLLRLAGLDSASHRSEGSIRPLALLTSGENLFPDVRDALEKWFKCRVYDAYISVEGGLVAMQCPHTNFYHVQSRRVELEILRRDGCIANEGTGELVLTNLSNWAMPLIRYRTGDHGTLEPCCPCGHPGPTLLALPARESCIFQLPESAVATDCLDPILVTQQVKQFQLVQTRDAEFSLTWIPASAELDREAVGEWLGRRLKQVLMGVSLQVQAVDSITKPGGKVRRYVCAAPRADSPCGSPHCEPWSRILSAGGRRGVASAILSEQTRSLFAIAGRNVLWADLAAEEPALGRIAAFRYTLTCGALASDNVRFAVADRKGGIHTGDISTRKTSATIKGHRGSVTCIAFAGDGKHLVTGGVDGALRFWDARTLVPTSVIRTRKKSILCLATSFDGMLLAAAGSDGRIRIWDGTTLGRIRSFGWNPTLSLSFSPDGDALAGGCEDHTVQLWDACSGRLLAVLRGHKGPVSRVSFSPDAKTLVSGSLDGTVRLWHAWTGRHLATLTGHRGGVRSLFITSDGRTVVSSGEDGTVRLWAIVPATEQ